MLQRLLFPLEPGPKAAALHRGLNEAVKADSNANNKDKDVLLRSDAAQPVGCSFLGQAGRLCRCCS
jgi:hypothetical protein